MNNLENENNKLQGNLNGYKNSDKQKQDTIDKLEDSLNYKNLSLAVAVTILSPEQVEHLTEATHIAERIESFERSKGN